MPKVTKKGKPGSELFGDFLERNDLSNAEAARALHVSRPTIFAWREGDKIPTAAHRAAIAKWTEGTVPESSWPLSEKEAGQLDALKSVEAFGGTGTDGD